jgi:hypothetical protein
MVKKILSTKLGWVTADKKTPVYYDDVKCVCTGITLEDDGSATIYLTEKTIVRYDDKNLVRGVFQLNAIADDERTFTVKVTDVTATEEIAEEETSEDEGSVKE